jgi:hypothetical protein
MAGDPSPLAAYLSAQNLYPSLDSQSAAGAEDDLPGALQVLGSGYDPPTARTSFDQAPANTSYTRAAVTYPANPGAPARIAKGTASAYGAVTPAPRPPVRPPPAPAAPQSPLTVALLARVQAALTPPSTISPMQAAQNARVQAALNAGRLAPVSAPCPVGRLQASMISPARRPAEHPQASALRPLEFRLASQPSAAHVPRLGLPRHAPRHVRTETRINGLRVGEGVHVVGVLAELQVARLRIQPPSGLGDEAGNSCRLAARGSDPEALRFSRGLLSGRCCGGGVSQPASAVARATAPLTPHEPLRGLDPNPVAPDPDRRGAGRGGPEEVNRNWRRGGPLWVWRLCR